jgi:hypothetical protein
MPTKHAVNLLPKDTFYESRVGKTVKWAITFGRWIVVFTDFIVISSFLSRFYFDTKLADYHDEIKQKQTIIEALAPFEDSFRLLQERISLIKTSSVTKMNGEQKTAFITEVLPPDVSLTTISFAEDKINFSGVALSQAGMARLINNLIRSPTIKDVRLSQLAINTKEGAETINFSLSGTWKSL